MEELSIKDKVRILLKSPSKLVLVQQHELERMMGLKRGVRSYDYIYVEQLYKHYILEKKPKTYINS